MANTSPESLTLRKRTECRFCHRCGNEFMFKLSQLNKYKGGGKFCSRECHYKYYSENPEKRPCYKSEWGADSFGYLVKRIRCVDGKVRLIRQHRWLMENKIGRRLKADEHVHHVNGDKKDNRIGNLTILSGSEHHKEHYNENPEFYHACLKKAQKVLRLKWDRWRKTHWSHKYRKCISCDKTESKHQGNGYCTKCYLSIYNGRY